MSPEVVKTQLHNVAQRRILNNLHALLWQPFVSGVATYQHNN